MYLSTAPLAAGARALSWGTPVTGPPRREGA